MEFFSYYDKYYTTYVDWNTCQNRKKANSNLLYDFTKIIKIKYFYIFDFKNMWTFVRNVLIWNSNIEYTLTYY